MSFSKKKCNGRKGVEFQLYIPCVLKYKVFWKKNWEGHIIEIVTFTIFS